VGSGIIRQLLLEGATVVAPLRRQQQIEALCRDCAGGLSWAGGWLAGSSQLTGLGQALMT
jgi:hypothetical protein